MNRLPRRRMSWEKKAGVMILLFGIGILSWGAWLHLHRGEGFLPPAADMAIGAALIIAGLGTLLNRSRR
jgi:drug/metabolite transporter (DMT)-like permease